MLHRKQNFPEEANKILENAPDPVRWAVRMPIAQQVSSWDFSIQTHLINYPVNGRVPIGVPNGTRLTGLEVRDTAKNVLREGQDYLVYRLRENHLLYIKLLRDVGGVGYMANFNYEKKETPVPADELNFSAQNLSYVDNELKAAEIDQIVDAMMRDHHQSRSTNAMTIASEIQRNSTYTYSSQMWELRGDRSNPFYKYSIFVDKTGHVFIQCSGANSLLKTYLNESYKMSGTANAYMADNLTAWVMTEDAPVVTLDGGHFRTMVEHRGADHESRILDGTPFGVGSPSSSDKRQVTQKPSYELSGSKLGVEHPIKKTEGLLDPWLNLRAILPAPVEVPVPNFTEIESPVPPVEEKIEPQPENVDLNQEELLRNLKELALLRQRLLNLFEEVVREDKRMRRIVGFEEIPGHQSVVLARRLQAYVLGEYNEASFLVDFISVSLRWPQPSFQASAFRQGATTQMVELKAQGLGMNAIIAKLANSAMTDFISLTKYVEHEVAEEGSKVEFTLDDEYQLTVRQILKLMASKQWGQLTPEYRAKFADCEDALRAKGAVTL